MIWCDESWNGCPWSSIFQSNIKYRSFILKKSTHQDVVCLKYPKIYPLALLKSIISVCLEVKITIFQITPRRLLLSIFSYWWLKKNWITFNFTNHSGLWQNFQSTGLHLASNPYSYLPTWHIFDWHGDENHFLLDSCVQNTNTAFASMMNSFGNR